MFIRNVWYVAAWSKELAASPIGRMIIGEPVVFWRRADGAVVAMEDRCPHRHAALSLGRVEGDTIRCMYHGLKLGQDGACLEIPGATVIPAHAAAKTYPVVEKWSWLWIWMGEPALADPSLIPDAYGLDDPEWPMREGQLDYEADYQLVNDNLTDLSHLDFTHATTLAPMTGSIWSQDAPQITPCEGGIEVRRWFCEEHRRPDAPFAAESLNVYRYLIPGVFIMKTRFFPLGTAAACNFGEPDAEPLNVILEQQAVTPIAPGRSRYLFATGAGAKYVGPEDGTARIQVVQAAFDEDRRMIEAQQRIWNVTPPDHPKAFIPQDKAPALFRRMIGRKIAEEQAGGGESVAAE